MDHRQAETLAADFFQPFFTALKTGDLKALKSSMSPEMYQRYRVLLEENQEYSRFLRKYYHDTRLSIGNIEVIDDHIDVELILERPHGKAGSVHVKLVHPSAGIDLNDSEMVEYTSDESIKMPEAIDDAAGWQIDR